MSEVLYPANLFGLSGLFGGLSTFGLRIQVQFDRNWSLSHRIAVETLQFSRAGNKTSQLKFPLTIHEQLLEFMRAQLHALAGHAMTVNGRWNVSGSAQMPRGNGSIAFRDFQFVMAGHSVWFSPQLTPERHPKAELSTPKIEQAAELGNSRTGFKSFL